MWPGGKILNRCSLSTGLVEGLGGGGQQGEWHGLASNQPQPHVGRGREETLAFSVPLPSGAPKLGAHNPCRALRAR